MARQGEEGRKRTHCLRQPDFKPDRAHEGRRHLVRLSTYTVRHAQVIEHSGFRHIARCCWCLTATRVCASAAYQGDLIGRHDALARLMARTTKTSCSRCKKPTRRSSPQNRSRGANISGLRATSALSSPWTTRADFRHDVDPKRGFVRFNSAQGIERRP